jgi:CelD/BcsL family acetyltransferase involved in cellulose biosynthesis
MKWNFSVLRGHQGFETLRPRWQALVDQLPRSTYLQQPAWIGSYLATLPGSARQVHFVTASRGDELRGVLVLSRQGGLRGLLMPEVHMISGPHMVLADLVGDSEDRMLWPSMLEWLDRQHSMRWVVMRLPVVCATSTLGQALQGTRGRMLLQTNRTNSAWLDCSQGVDHALAAVSKSFRQNLKRLTRRAESTGALQYHAVTRPDELDAALEQFLAIESSGWKKDSGTAIAQDPKLVEFYRRLVHDFGASGQCRINLLTLDGVTVAAQFGLVSDRQLNLLKIGYSNDHTSIAPGNLIMRDTIEQVCADPALDRLCFVTHPPWAHLWKPNLTSVDYVTLFPATLAGKLAFTLSNWMKSRRTQAQTAVVTTAPEAAAPDPALRDEVSMDALPATRPHAHAAGMAATM